MTALAATPSTLKTAPRGRGSHIVTNAVTVYPQGGVGITTAGRLSPWADTAGLLWRGICMGGTTRNSSANAGGKVLGDTSATPPYEADVDESGRRLLAVPVAGASAQTNVDDLVFCPTDNLYTDLSLTATVNVGPIGRIKRLNSATSFDVELFTPNEYLAQLNRIVTVSFHIPLATVANGDIVTGFVPGFAGRILSLQTVNSVVVTTGAKAASLNAEIDGTNVTGGVVALTSANQTPLGARVAGSAVTAANHFTATSAIDIEASSVTTFVEGAVTLYLTLAVD